MSSTQFWNEMYQGGTYGIEPNDFLVDCASKLAPNARILSLGEGEGRNAVWLAKQGFRVHCLDLSDVGIDKLNQSVIENEVQNLVTTEVTDLSTYCFESGWDGIISIWCHLPPLLRQQVHANVVKSLSPGGIFIAEYYTPANIGRNTGGPQVNNICVTAQDATEELLGLDLIVVEKERMVSEGTYHNGLSAVLQILGTKS